MNGNTGDTRVDAALARLGELDEAPLDTHPEIFEAVHRGLQDALTGIEGENDPGGGGLVGERAGERGGVPPGPPATPAPLPRHFPEADDEGR